MTPTVMQWPDDIAEILDQLADLEIQLFVAGGAVRDALLRRPVRDLDLCTPESGLRVGRLVADRLDGMFYPLDADRDVGRVLLERPGGRFVIDISRFRAATLEDDLRDRDFTVNAMAVALQGDRTAIIDPCGGLSDLNQRALRQCAPGSIAADPIRALRAVRYAAQFGLRMAEDTRAAVREQVAALDKVSGERQRDELFKLLETPRPQAALLVAGTLGVLSRVLPATADWTTDDWRVRARLLERLTGFYSAIGPQRTDDTAARFDLGMFVMALDRYRRPLLDHLMAEPSDGRAARELILLETLVRDTAEHQRLTLADALRLSNAEKKRLLDGPRASLAVRDIDAGDALAVYRYWRAFDESGVDGLLIDLAVWLEAQQQTFDQDGWVYRLERARLLLYAWYDGRDTAVSPAPLLTGTDLMDALGLGQGPQIGSLLRALEEAQISGQVQSRDDALLLARSLLNGQA